MFAKLSGVLWMIVSTPASAAMTYSKVRWLATPGTDAFEPLAPEDAPRKKDEIG